MADFGKLNFSVALNPTSAFPVDARCYFNSLALAKAAAATAEEVGSTNTVYYFGMPLLVDDGTSVKWYIIQRDGTLLESTSLGGETTGGTTVSVDNHTIVIDDNGVLKVNTATSVEADNTRPITAAAVHTEVGNINVLLKTI